MRLQPPQAKRFSSESETDEIAFGILPFLKAKITLPFLQNSLPAQI
jgi:hypothetical protein